MANAVIAESVTAFSLLKQSYELMRNNCDALKLQEVSRSLGLSDALARRAYDFLLSRNFIRPKAADTFTVSEKGRDAVEWELARPSFLSEGASHE